MLERLCLCLCAFPHPSVSTDEGMKARGGQILYLTAECLEAIDGLLLQH